MTPFDRWPVLAWAAVCCVRVVTFAALNPARPLLLRCSLHVYRCSNADAAGAVAMLRSLPRLTAASLTIHAHWGADDPPYADCYYYPDVNDYTEWVLQPPMAALTALTSLELVGTASLPPDWHHLRALRRLAVTNGRYWLLGIRNNPWPGFDWSGAASLAALHCLTRVELANHAWLPGKRRAGSAKEGATPQMRPNQGRRLAEGCLRCTGRVSSSASSNPPRSTFTQNQRCWPPRPPWQRCTRQRGGLPRTALSGPSSCAACAPTSMSNSEADRVLSASVPLLLCRNARLCHAALFICLCCIVSTPPLLSSKPVHS